MTGASDDKRDFFISFTGADRPWARWLARVLGEEGYSFWFQDQDFHGSIPRSIGEAHADSNRTIVVLSEAYTKSGYCRSEWEMRYQEDPGVAQDLLILFRISLCTPDPNLARISYVDLFACDEAAARELVRHRLRQAAEPGYKIPLGEAAFPGRTPVDAPFPVPTHNLPPPNPDFVGREDILTAIREALTKGAPGAIAHTYAITGLGGVGKTQTALAYCYHHLSDYRLIWWVRAAESATFAADFMALAGPLGLPEERDQAKAVQAVKNKLQNTPGGLLVFDNAEDPATVRPYLPGTGGGHTLLTSRRTDWQSVAKVLELAIMKEDEALQLLTGRPDHDTLPAAERAAAEALAKELGYLPLALAQARAYMAGTGKSLAGYRRLFEASRPAVLEKGRASLDYPTSVAKTWQISIEAAESECAAARSLLELLAFFAPDVLPIEMLASVPATLPEGLGDELERDEAIAALHRFSLLRAEAGTLIVHRLVQAVTRDGLPADDRRRWTEVAVRLVNAALPRPPEEHTNWLAIKALLPHALATAEAGERLEAGLEIAATVLNQTALYHSARAAWAEAEPLFLRSLKIQEKVFGPESLDVAESLNNLAQLYWYTGRYAEAEPLFLRSLKIREKVSGPKSPALATGLHSLAQLYLHTGRYAEAELLFLRSLAIVEKVSGPESATGLHSLAQLYLDTGRYAEAEPLFLRSLKIREKVFGPESPRLATGLNGLASLYWKTGRYAEAELLFLRSLKIREKVFGPEHPEEHPDVAQSLNNLALLYRDTGRYAEAEPLFQRSLKIQEKVSGPEHPELATGLDNLALLYCDTGRYAEAEPLFQRAMAIREKTLPPDHPLRMWSRENYAGLLGRLGRDVEAAALRAQTPAIR